MIQFFGKQYSSFLKISKNLLNNLEFPVVGTDPRSMKAYIQKRAYMHVYKNLFKKSPNW
jgi:hypothetical protein